MEIVTLMEKITYCVDNIKAVISVFIDLKKAFDTIDHTILLQKLNHCEICGTLIGREDSSALRNTLEC